MMDAAAPKFRHDLRMHRQETAQGVWYVVKDPVTNKFFRFREAEHFIAKNLDGNTPPELIRERVQQQFGAALLPETLDAFLSHLDKVGLLENERSARKRHSKREKEKRLQGSLLYLRYKILNPERILEYLIRRVRFVFTPYAVAFSAGVILLSVLTTIGYWDEYVADLPRLFTLEAIPTFIMLGFLVISGHEFAHGLTCRHFGGKVREMGFMLMYFQPAFYCNVSDAWLFPKKSRRLWVGFAGMYFEFFVWALAVLFWRITDTDTFINFAALMVMTGSGISTLANLNPLIKLDGYYMLSDYLDMPNLRKKSFRYIGDSLKSIFGIAERPDHNYSPRERRVFVTYGTISTLASFSLMSIAAIEVGSFLLEQSQPLVFSLFFGLLGTRFRTRLQRLFGRGKGTSLDPEEDSADDFAAHTNGKRYAMRDALRSDAAPVKGHEERRQYKLRPAQSFQQALPHQREAEASPPPSPPVHDRAPVSEPPPPPTISKQAEMENRGEKPAPAPYPEPKREKSSKSSRRKKKSKINPRLYGILAACLGFILIFGWMELRVTGPFNILPIQYVDTRAEVEGIVTEVLVNEGQQVEAGDVIARISDREYRSQLQQNEADMMRMRAQLQILERGPTAAELEVAEAAVKRARERLTFERGRVERSKLLYDKGILSLMEYEDAQLQLNSAENDQIDADKRLQALVRRTRPEEITAARAQLSSLEAQRRTLEFNVQRVEIRAKAAGIVSTPARQLRELLYQRADRGTLIARISTPRKLMVEIAVSEKDIADIKMGQTVAFKARAFPHDTFYGVITGTAQTAGAQPAATPAAGAAPQLPSTTVATILVTSEIDNSSLSLKPGMTGHAKIYCGERRLISLIFRRLIQTIKVEFWSWW